MSTLGDILSTMGDVQYRENIMINVGDILSTAVPWGGYLEYHGGYSVPWGYHDARGGYHE